MRKIYKYEIPVDDRWHDILLTGPIVHVAALSGEAVTCWAIHDSEATPSAIALQVFGTGHQIEGRDGCEMSYIGTGIVPTGPYIFGAGLVWHLVAAVDVNQAKDGRNPLDRSANWLGTTAVEA